MMTEKLEQLSRAFAEIPFNQMLGLQLNDLNTDHITFNFLMKKELIGNFLHGILHGGVISSVLDMAGGMVVMASIIQKHADSPLEELAALIGKTSTVDLQISYLRPGKGEIFIAKAWLVKSGNKIAFARMELCNQDNVLIATGTGTYLIN
ncbi:MAG: thioesterase family protein [Gammaproteobacteria bacterium]|nr:MAG: thioesterase family protein [Gammaproteobacteria bacterium]